MSRPWNSVGDCLIHHAAERPEAPAILAPGREVLTYGRLLSQATYVRETLREAGVEHRDRVAMVLPHGAELATAFLCVGASAASAPLNPMYGVRELLFYLSDLNAKVLVLEAGSDGPARAAADQLAIQIIELAPAPNGPAGLFHLNDFRGEAQAGRAFSGSDDVALLLHTSGTTSRPKLVPLSHRNLSASAHNIMTTLALTPRDRCLNVMPLFHIHGLIGATLSSTAAGASVVCCPQFDADAFFSWCDEFGPSWYSAVPTMHQAILSRADTFRPSVDKTSFRFVRSSSASLPPNVMQDLEDLFGCPVIESYGMTEACHQMASNPLPPALRKCGSVGVAAGPDVAIMDGAGHLLPAGQAGEIVIRGDNVTTGYENNSGANAEAFTNGWFRTGDQGYIDEHGYVTISGRLKEIINRGGEKVSPREVDEVLLQHSAVLQAVTFANPHPTLGEDVVAAVIKRPDREVSEQDLREYARDRLADFKVPSRILFLNNIPVGPTGKLQRNGLADRLGHLLTVEYVEPQGEVEQALARIWAELLQIDRFGARDNVFASGADSLLATRAAARINAEFHIQLPLEWIQQSPTVRELAPRVAEHRGRGESGLAITKLVDRADIPVSYAQERLWFLDHLEAGLVVNNRPTIMRLRGALDVEALRRALQGVFERHEILRTSYREADGQLVQRVEPVRELEFPVVDLRAYAPEQREERSMARVVEEARAPFDLASGDMLRCVLLRHEDDLHVLVVTSHHIAFDGWSESVLYRELAVAYEAFAAGHDRALPPPPIQYTDFAAWQRRTMTTEMFEDGLAYWEQAIGVDPPPLALPIDRRRPPVQSFEGARRFLQIPDTLRQDLVALSTTHGVTLFTTLLSAYATVLHRFSGQSVLVIGTPFAGRDQYETEPLIGSFINPVPICCDLADDPTFAQLLQRLREVLQAAQKHRNLPFQLVVQRLLKRRDRSRAPVFHTLMVFENLPPSPRTWGEVVVEPIEIDFNKALLDISLELMDTPEGLHGYLEYATDIFDPETIETMATSYLVLLESIVREPDRTIGALPLLPAHQQAQLLRDLTRPTASPGGPECIHHYIEQHALRTPDAIALSCMEDSLTYGELDERAERLTGALLARGLQRGDHVGICMERGIDMFVGVVAVLKAGGVYLPLDPAYPARRLTYMVNDANVAILLTKKAIRGCFTDHCANVISMDEDLADRRFPTPHLAVGPNDPAYLIYTSGSTGDPKGVSISHGNLISAFEAWHALYDLHQIRTHLQTASFSFDVAAGDWTRALCSGGRLVIATREQILSAPALLDLMEREQIEFVDMSKGVIQNLFRHVRQVGKDTDFVKQYVVGAEPWSPQEFAEIANALGPSTRIYNTYGVTETTVDNSVLVDGVGPQSVTPVVSIGRPLQNSNFYVLDTALRPVPDGVCGELVVGGECVANGYLNDKQLTAQRFVSLDIGDGPSQRVYRTGDLVRRRTDGNHDFIGRMDRQLKVRGFRVEAGEVEVTLRSHEAIREAIVTDLQTRSNGHELIAYVVFDPSLASSPADIGAWMREQIPAHMVPNRIVAIDSIPRTPSGKVDRRALPKPTADDGPADATGGPPRTEIEKWLAAIWSEVLGIEKVGSHSSFFELGGHSLTAIKILNRVRAHVGADPPLHLLFESPVLTSFASAVDDWMDREGFGSESLTRD